MSYLNTKPLVYGLEKHPIQNAEISFYYPALLAEKLLNDEIDVGLIPVAMIPKLSESHIITDFCIGATSPVATVCLFSNVPIEEIEKVYLDYQSRTSVALLKILLRDYWHFSPEFIIAEEGFEKKLNGTTAGLIIGDRAFQAAKDYPYVYDLASAWINLTALPFVFAAWVANKQLPTEFIEEFNLRTGEGLAHIDEIVAANPYPLYDLKEYYTENIDYRLDGAKREGLKLFLEKIANNA